MHSLHTNRTVPHALESALLLCGAGLGALEPEALGTRPAEWRRGIAEREASVVKEAETHARRGHCVWVVNEEGERGRGSRCSRNVGVVREEGRNRPVVGSREFSAWQVEQRAVDNHEDIGVCI